MRSRLLMASSAALVWGFLLLTGSWAFCPQVPAWRRLQQQQRQMVMTSDDDSDNVSRRDCDSRDNQRRSVLAQACNALLLAGVGGGTNSAAAEEASPSIAALAMSTLSTESAAPTPAVAMKEFVDPYGMFVIRVPEDFYTLRRKSKGDLPDAQGKGRRGSSIFTAGNMAKAEVVAVERFPTKMLLEENGIEATGSLATFPDIGEPSVVAGLINQRRERERAGPSNTKLEAGSVAVSSDGKELAFALRTEIEVQKPELLMEQYGVDRLYRVTVAKASLQSNDGNILAVFASALETDFRNSADGPALQAAVDSFAVMDREFGF